MGMPGWMDALSKWFPAAMMGDLARVRQEAIGPLNLIRVTAEGQSKSCKHGLIAGSGQHIS